MGDIDGFGRSVSQVSASSPARINSCALATPHTLEGIIVALYQLSLMFQKQFEKYEDLM